ncbi:MAG: hypothetical protein QM645_09020 [Asticcacaulis sp.]
MKTAFSLCVVTISGFCPAVAFAGAWPQEIGHIQVISRAELTKATQAFDAQGNRGIELDRWEEKSFSVFVDYGLTERISLSGKINFQDYRTEWDSFSGLGSVEIGARYNFLRTEKTVLSLGLSAEGLGEGRRNAFEDGHPDSTDVELRGYIGRNFTIKGIPSFVDLQLARRVRSHDADQWRGDVTLGIKPDEKWMVLAQVFDGRTDLEDNFQAIWVNGELSVVRAIGPENDLSLQLSARQTLYGKNVPEVSGLGLSLWKSF